MTADTPEPSDGDHAERDVVVVGGGPAGCAAAMSTARYGLDVVLFDRGNAALRRCAFLGNYLGFPAGIGVGTFYELMHDHVEESGGDLVPDMVESVTRTEGGFHVETQDGRTVDTRRVVAATTYDLEYLRGLDDEDAMFEVHGHGEGEHRHVDADYVGDDGSTPIEGLYVAGALAGAGAQALTAAGHGMRVGLELVADVRRAQGYWEEAAVHRDWSWRRDALQHDWDDEAAWHERFAHHRLPADHDVDPDRLREVREREVERLKATHLTREEVETRVENGQRRLAEHLDSGVLLDSLDDEAIREYVLDHQLVPESR